MSTTPITAVRAAPRPRTQPKTQITLQRERHQPDYAILVAIVALAAIGILMVYSSSAMKAYVQQDDTFAIVGPQILWAALGLVAMVVMMRVDYRWLRLVSVPRFIVGVVLLLLVFVPPINVVVGGSARWLVIGPLPAVHPAEFTKLALIVYLAHWFAKRGSTVRGFRTGTVPFLVITVPIIVLVFNEPDLGHVVRHRVHRVHHVLRRGREPASSSAGARRPPVPAVALRSLPARPDQDLPRPVGGPARRRLPHDPGPARAGARWHLRERASARASSPAACTCRTPGTTSSTRSSARSSGSSAPGS